MLALPLSDDLDIAPDTELAIQTFWSIAIDCAVQSMLRTARPSRTSRLQELLASKHPARYLPPLLGLIDFMGERKRADVAAAQCRSWKQYDPKLRCVARSAYQFTLNGDDWTGTLRLHARGDFDGDGYEDLLIRRDAGSNCGSYRASALFLITMTEADRCVRVIKQLGRS
jgi:hypothetical protein